MKRAREHRPGALPLLGSGGGGEVSRVSWVLSSLDNLKYKSGN